jgi:hypothetical protein
LSSYSLYRLLSQRINSLNLDHDMDQSLVVNLNQAAINGIRAAGATSQYITVEGNDWTRA